MSKPGFFDVEQSHIDELFKFLRISDITEMKAMNGHVAREIIERSVEMSIWSRVYLDCEGKVVAIGGVARHKEDENIGVIWMMGTSLVKKNAAALAYLPQLVVDTVHKLYGISHFCNFIYANNTTSINWLVKNGFEIRGKQRTGVENKYFCFFERNV